MASAPTPTETSPQYTQIIIDFFHNNEILSLMHNSDNLNVLAGVHAGLLGVIITIVALLPALLTILSSSPNTSAQKAVDNNKIRERVSHLWLSVLIHSTGLCASLLGKLFAFTFLSIISWTCCIAGIILLSRLGIFLARRTASEFK